MDIKIKPLTEKQIRDGIAEIKRQDEAYANIHCSDQSGYLYFMDVPEWEAEECPKCGEGISANWIQGQGYYYCGNGCELTVDDIEERLDESRNEAK